MPGNIDAEFGHCRNGVGIQADGSRPRAEDLKLISCYGTQEAFGHLATS